MAPTQRNWVAAFTDKNAQDSLFTKGAFCKEFSILRCGLGGIVRGKRMPANWRNVKSAGGEDFRRVSKGEPKRACCAKTGRS